MLMSLPQLRTNIRLFEIVIRLVPAKLWNFLETRMLYNMINVLKINCGVLPTDEPWKPPAPTRNTAPPGREAGHHDSDQLNWSTDNFTNRSSPEPLFKKRVHTFRREDSWGMRRTDTVESFDTYRMSPIETPLSDFVDRYNRERSRSPSVHSEKMAEMDTRLSELEENTKRSLYNIETLLRNAVFSRASTSVNRRHSRARDRHRDRDSVM